MLRFCKKMVNLQNKPGFLLPLLLKKEWAEHTRIAVWKIEEDESFFLQTVQLQSVIHHPHKRLQHLAGRYLLSLLFAGFPYHQLKLNEAGKPYLPSEQYLFSISHCGDYAAVIISTEKQCGIDIEQYSAKTERVKYKYLSEDELAQIDALQKRYGYRHDAHELYTLCWCAKEAVYKWWGNGKVDFRKHIIIRNISLEEERITVHFANEAISENLFLCMVLMNGICLVWTGN